MSKNNFCKKFAGEFEKIRKSSLINFIDKPNIQLIGNEELFAEGIISIYKYTNESISFSVNYLIIEIEGKCLEMRFYTKTTIKISGFIDSVRLEGCKKEC